MKIDPRKGIAQLMGSPENPVKFVQEGHGFDMNGKYLGEVDDRNKLVEEFKPVYELVESSDQPVHKRRGPKPRV